MDLAGQTNNITYTCIHCTVDCDYYDIHTCTTCFKIKVNHIYKNLDQRVNTYTCMYMTFIHSNYPYVGYLIP